MGGEAEGAGSLVVTGSSSMRKRRLTGVVNPQAERTTWAYDPLGRATTVSYQDGSAVTFAYGETRKPGETRDRR